MSAESDRIAALCARYALPSGAAESYEELLALVAAEPMALTTVRDPAEAVDVHLADSLAGLELAVVREASSIADLGSGAGFPGLVLAIALPGATVHLVESVAKKAGFLERAAARLGVANAVVEAVRAEDWSGGLGRNDVVTARALASLPVLLEYAAPLLVAGGAFVAWKGRRDASEEEAGARAADLLGMTEPEATVVPSGLVRSADERHLYLSLKVGVTPPDYPRRAGMARKRPLGI